MPVVTGDQLSWPVVSAKTINVHRGDGSYVESLPGSATSWTAPVPGDYYLVAANREHWSSWPKSDTVTVGSPSNVPMPIVIGDQLNWPVVSAKTINVHRGDGSYVESLPGSATSWTAPVPGDYYLVAANREHWSSWPKSDTVTVGSSSTVPMPVVTYDQLSWPVVSAKTINVHRGDGSYVESLPGSATTWTAPVPGDYYLVAANREHWSSWPKSDTVTVGSGNITTPMITEANYVDLLRQVFSIYTGTDYRDKIRPLPTWTDPVFLSWEPPAERPVIYEWEFENETICSNGGTVDFLHTYQFDGFHTDSATYGYDFDNCQHDAVILDGDFSSTRNSGGFPTYTFESVSFVLDGQTYGVQYTGRNSLFLGARGREYERRWSASAMDLHWYDGVSDVRISDANTSFLAYTTLNAGFGNANLSGSFTLRSIVTGGRSMEVAVIEPFALQLSFENDFRDIPWRFPEGLLQLSAEDGSQLTFNASNGDYLTVDIKIEDSSGRVTSLPDHSWEPWLDQLDLVQIF